jgi:hypothetical protein
MPFDEEDVTAAAAVFLETLIVFDLGTAPRGPPPRIDVTSGGTKEAAADAAIISPACFPMRKAVDDNMDVVDDDDIAEAAASEVIVVLEKREVQLDTGE